MTNQPKVAIYLSSKAPEGSIVSETAYELGYKVASRYDVLFGGRTVGCMGKLADGVIAAKGQIMGVVPQRLRSTEPESFPCKYIDDDIDERSHPLQRRKMTMFSNADAFIVCPGGLGTLDELAEVLALQQLKYIENRPIVLLNQDGYWDHLIEHLKQAFTMGFIPRDPFESYLHIANTVEECLVILDTSFDAGVANEKETLCMQ